MKPNDPAVVEIFATGRRGGVAEGVGNVSRLYYKVLLGSHVHTLVIEDPIANLVRISAIPSAITFTHGNK